MIAAAPPPPQNATGVITVREDSHFQLFAPFPVLRRVALELGRRLALRGALAEAHDIFLLELEEIAQSGSAAVTREVAAARKAAWDALGTRLPGVPAELLAAGERGGEPRGAAASPGQATGRVRLVLDERDFHSLRPGEVLVARYTSPAWTPLFSSPPRPWWMPGERSHIRRSSRANTGFRP